jgi:hypothetical protein
MSENELGYEKIAVLLRKFALPSITSTLVSSLYNIVDQIFIGQGVGYLGNAATNVSYPFSRSSCDFPAGWHRKRFPVFTVFGPKEPRSGKG